ncbi:MAG: tetratricopeptide repeat protein [Nitrospirae bacterium]|nr:tetratricopeptide repeat protein [Nitrospirota bacterium]
MKFLRVFVFTLFTLYSFPDFAVASVPEGASALIQIRAGEHAGFMRIVLEGDESVISEGKASREGKDIIVRFTDKNFEIKKTYLPFAVTTDKDALMFSLKQEGKLKAYSLKDPSRFVIDVYPKEEAIKKQAKQETKPQAENAERIKTPSAPEVHNEDRSARTGGNNVATPEKEYDEKSLIPEKYKAMWALLEAGNFYAVLKEPPGHKPENAESLAALNYIYAKANIMAKQYLEAVKYFRLAYIYATDNALKEQALLRRAALYLELKLVHEARADYLVFIRDFPSSGYIDKAYFGLAESLYRIGLYQEAIEYYKKSGKGPLVLYGMANAMQKLEMTAEAKKAYGEARLMDDAYLKSSPETDFLLGENMRMSGDTVNAKKHLSQIESGPYRDNAIISLGLIAMEEPNLQEAVRQFKAAAQSREQKVKVQALFNLSLAHMKEGKFKEATESLEEIRHNHIDSNMYKDALLALSKIYKKGGRGKEAVSLLKELVYGKQPPPEAFSTLEEIVLETGAKSSTDGLTFVKLWNEVGQWLVDEAREDFLLKVAKRLRHEGKPFIDLCTWLVENGSEHAKGKAAIDLADYYSGIGNAAMSRDYMNIAKDSRETGDAVSRVEAKILYSEGEQTAALKHVMMIKEIEKSDLDLLGNIISGLDYMEMKDAHKAIAFYERNLNEADWDAEAYINFADILYANNDTNKALKYYRIAGEKAPENEWVMYRLARDAGAPESTDILNRLQKGDNLFARLAKSKLMEKTLMNRVREVF